MAPQPPPHPTPPPSIMRPLGCDAIRQVWLLPRWIHLDTRPARRRGNPKRSLCSSRWAVQSLRQVPRRSTKAWSGDTAVPQRTQRGSEGGGRPMDEHRRGRRRATAAPRLLLLLLPVWGAGLSPFFFLQDKELSLRERPKRALGGESGLIPPPSSFLFSSLASSSPPLCVSLTLFNPT